MSEPTPTEETMANSDSGWMSWFTAELTGSPVNCILLVAIVYLLYKIFKSDEGLPGKCIMASVLNLKYRFISQSADFHPIEPPSSHEKRDFTLKELKELGDGTSGEGRILVAVNGKVYDVTKGKRFYGPVPGPSTPIEPPVPPMKKRDFTLKELKELGDGTSGEGRILVAVNGKVYDVTKGKRFYG
ncbi:hypothetical protein TCAL_15698, partial [Tigriopus californicus]